jgi:hypothetical protein
LRVLGKGCVSGHHRGSASSCSPCCGCCSGCSGAAVTTYWCSQVRQVRKGAPVVAAAAAAVVVPAAAPLAREDVLLALPLLLLLPLLVGVPEAAAAASIAPLPNMLRRCLASSAPLTNSRSQPAVSSSGL